MLRVSLITNSFPFILGCSLFLNTCNLRVFFGFVFWFCKWMEARLIVCLINPVLSLQSSTGIKAVFLRMWLRNISSSTRSKASRTIPSVTVPEWSSALELASKEGESTLLTIFTQWLLLSSVFCKLRFSSISLLVEDDFVLIFRCFENVSKSYVECWHLYIARFTSMIVFSCPYIVCLSIHRIFWNILRNSIVVKIEIVYFKNNILPAYVLVYSSIEQNYFMLLWSVQSFH